MRGERRCDSTTWMVIKMCSNRGGRSWMGGYFIYTLDCCCIIVTPVRKWIKHLGSQSVKWFSCFCCAILSVDKFAAIGKGAKEKEQQHTIHSGRSSITEDGEVQCVYSSNWLVGLLSIRHIQGSDKIIINIYRSVASLVQIKPPRIPSLLHSIKTLQHEE